MADSSSDLAGATPGAISSVTAEGPTVVAAADTGRFYFTAFSDNIVHVVFAPTNARPDLPMWGLRPRVDTAPDLQVAEEGDAWRLTAPGIAVLVEKSSAACRFIAADGTPLTALEMVGMTPIRLSGEATYHVYAAFSTGEGEAFYGLGQHQRDWMDHARREVSLGHDYKAHGGEIIGIPFLVTNSGYGVVWDNPARGNVWPARKGQTVWWSEVGDAVSFFVIAGRRADDIYAGYRTLCGAIPLPPLAALGYIQCKQRYRTQDELMEVARTYRDRQYPCDMLVVDWFHWEVLGDMDLKPESWPDPAAMNRALSDLGFGVMVSCWPRFMKESRHYEELERNGWFMKDASGATVYGTPDDRRGALLDTTNPDAGRWFWDTIQASYGARGFSSWWLDEDEPDISPHAFYLHAGTGARVHNLYPLTHCRAVYEGHRRDRPDRCLTLSRSAYHGAQCCGTTFWSSDIHPDWDVFRRQIPCGLNVCATGFPYWSSDIGGWHPLPRQADTSADFHSLLIETGEERPDSGRRLNYTELYVRWFQYGAFCPTFRAHGTRPQNEVWSYGAEAETIMVEYLKLRYRLLPYIYSLAWRATQTGAPFMRALWMDFPDDPAVRDLKYQYLFGPAFLVAPVIEPGAVRRDVYLPQGAEWYNYWTGARHAGGRVVTVDAPLARLPLFVRAGSVIPYGEVVPHTGVRQEKIELHVYEGADVSFELYRDDGTSYAYEGGSYELTPLRWDDSGKTIDVGDDPEGLFARPSGEWLIRHA